MSELPNIEQSYFKEGEVRGEILDPSKWFDKWEPEKRELTAEEKKTINDRIDRDKRKFNFK